MVEASYINCAKRATDAKPRTEVACQLCRGAKEEDRRSKGDLGGNVNIPGEEIVG